MFDRFTERARKVMSLARQEAQRASHDYIGTEHILLGLVAEGSGVAAQVLRRLEVEPRRIRTEVEKIVKDGTSMATMGQLPFTPLAKKVLEFSLEEAQNLGHSYLGTEHLLLGLIRETDGIAARVLRELGVEVESVREEVLALLGADPSEGGREVEARPVVPPEPTMTSDVVRALRQADRESERRRHGFIGTEHLLLGVVAGDDAAARVLHECGATPLAVQHAVDELRAPGTAEVRDDVPDTSASAARALDRAWNEAGHLGHARVDSRHLALALLSVREGLASHVLHRLVAAPDALAAKLRALPPPA